MAFSFHQSPLIHSMEGEGEGEGVVQSKTKRTEEKMKVGLPCECPAAGTHPSDGTVCVFKW